MFITALSGCLVGCSFEGQTLLVGARTATFSRMVSFAAITESLLLLLAANGAPIVARKLMRGKCAYPVDGGGHFIDGRRWFGRSKTWRGILWSVWLTALAAMLLDLPAGLGVGFAVLTLLGDLAASFCKRRLAYPESSHAPGLDTLPESALPLLWLQDRLGLSLLDVALACFIFFLLEECLSPLLYRWHIRRRPY